MQNHRSCGVALTLTALGVLAAFGERPARADITGGVGSGSLSMEIVGEGIVGAAGPSGIPRYPGGLGLGGGGGSGSTTGFLGLSWDFTPGLASAFIPNSLVTTFLSQSIPSPLPGPEPGKATLHGDFSVVFSIDGAGAPSTTATLGYALTMIIDGSVSFDMVVDFDSGALGALGTRSLHFARTTSGGFATLLSDSGTLPALPGGDTLTLSGTVDISVDDNPGGSATQIVVQSAPEPGTLALAALGLGALIRSAKSRRRR